MRKSVVILISVVTLALFIGLVHYGWTHRWGGTMDTTVEEPAVLSMPYVDKELTLELDDFAGGPWQELSPLTVSLLHQVTVAPWGRSLVPTVEIRAFHNGKEAHLLFEWQDEAPSRGHDVAQFPDGVAVAFLLSPEPPEASIMMGFRSVVNIWQWKANLDAIVWGDPDTPQRLTPNTYYTYNRKADLPTAAETVSNACQDLLAARPGTVTVKETNHLSGRGRWHDGTWRVIIKRPLTTEDHERDAQLASGKNYVSFAVWEGEKGDRGSRKSISDWVVLDIEPRALRADTSAANRSSVYAAGISSEISAALSALTMLGADDSAVRSGATSEEPRVIDILAKRFEYNPSEITLQRGELVTFRMESLDVTHGLYLDGYGIDIKARPGIIGKATFRADKTGRFTFRCSETCGEFHPYMIGYLTVEPNRRYYLFAVIAVGMGLVLAIVTLLRKKSDGATSNG